jgi:hypothetical protein
MDVLEALQFYRLMYVVAMAAASPFFVAALCLGSESLIRDGHGRALSIGAVVCGIVMGLFPINELLTWAGPRTVWHTREVDTAYGVGFGIGLAILTIVLIYRHRENRRQRT